MIEKNFFIKEGYKCNITDDHKNVATYFQPPNNDQYQLSVYRYLSNLFRNNKPDKVLELGFGNAFKSMKYLRPFCNKYYGVDMLHSVDFAKNNYPDEHWIQADFNALFNIDVKFDFVISVDVIEHLIYPEIFLESIKSIATKETQVLISTPERDLARGHLSMGPPENLKHVREWNQVEFRKFLEYKGFEIIEHFLLEDRDKPIRERIHNWRKGINTKTCQVILCKKKTT